MASSASGRLGAMKIEPYNPLDRVNLARSVEVTLMQQPARALPLSERFNGAGLYALYYVGDFRPYTPISSEDCRVPIYVGKADPPGSRKGLIDASAANPALHRRIADHVKSIEWARNLNVDDFRVRFLIVEDSFIGMGEALLIQQFRPLWNQHVAGFGIHEPGKGRHKSKRSEWDELHPGRPWHGKMQQATTASAVKRNIKAAFESGEAATLVSVAVGSPPASDVSALVPIQPEEQPE
jgi:hypothetical protein